MAGRLLPALAYDAVIAPFEALGLARQRAHLLANARGRVLEIGAGTGLNMRHYRAAGGLPGGAAEAMAVSSVVAVEPDDSLRSRLVRRAARAAVPVDVVAAGIPGLDFEDSSFDTVVCILVLCTVVDVEGSLAEMRRLVRPDGQVLFLEHIVGPRRSVARIQHRLCPVWAGLAGGCQIDRDTIGALRGAGFVVIDCERLAPFGGLTAGTVVRGAAIPGALVTGGRR